MSKDLKRWDQAKAEGRRLALLTAYDYPFARLAASAGLDGLLVGDSLGMAVAGERDTLGVTLEDIAYHTRLVARGAGDLLVMADLPFGTYEAGPAQAMASAATLLKAGADMVKFEGGAPMVETVGFLAARGVPVCAHIGLTPQHVRLLGGFRRQGRGEAAARRLAEDASALAAAGARLLLIEAIPAPLAAEITRAIPIPTIGIGAGGATDAQILVLHDLLGLGLDPAPSFVKRQLDGAALVRAAMERYAAEVRERQWPALDP